jgi:ferrochelatase
MSARRALFLVNLGSPDSTSIPDVRRYLDEFLMDERVIDVPWLLRRFIISCFILPFRPKKSAHAYSNIWTPEGSPLIITSRRLQAAVAERVPMKVGLGMRYGNPSIRHGLEELLQDKSLEEIFMIPLYPHYAMSSFETVVVKAREEMRAIGSSVTLTVIDPFYKDPLYLDALEASIRPYLEAPWDHFLFSYHGVPRRHLLKGDPSKAHCMKVERCCEQPCAVHAVCYRHQCVETTRHLVERLGIPQGKYTTSFQSRLGNEEWCMPYTDETIAALARSGVKRLVVACPAFVADCLETIEEIGIEGKETFLENGGEEFRLVPCLNTHPRWVDALAAWSTRPR